MASKIITVAGITGRFGRYVTQHLLTKPNVRVNGLARTPSKLPQELSSDPRVKLFQNDATDSPTMREALKGASAVVCCYLADNKVMYEGQKTLIDASIEEGVPRYLASDFALDFRGLNYGDIPPKDPMKQIQEYLEEKEAKNQIKGVHVLTGAFMDFASILSSGDAGVFRYFGTGDEGIDMTSDVDSARYTAEVALDDDANGWIEVRGDRKSVKQLAATFKDVFGKEPKLEHQGSIEDMKKTIERMKVETPHSWSIIGMQYNLHMISNPKTVLQNIANDHYPNIKPIDIAQFYGMKKKGYKNPKTADAESTGEFNRSL